MDARDRLGLSLALLRRGGPLDVEAVAALLLEAHPPDVVRGALERGLGLACGADAACAVARDVPADRVAAARDALREAGFADLLDG